ncbi:MAG: hypothetical protein WCD76_14835 [Pyrinomonadaceae bacterium]
MRRKFLTLVTAVLCLSATASRATAQTKTATVTTTPATQGQQPPAPSARQALEATQLSAAEASLVQGSRNAILAAGLSAPYFEKHFRLAKVVNAQGDRRVVWRLRINEYETVLSDSVGFYTDARGRRIDTHTVVNLLPSAREIERTIPRAQAMRIMRACIGPFRDGGVIYAAQGTPPHAALFFNASANPPARARGRRVREERREREERERKAGRKTAEQKAVRVTDEIENENEEGGPPVSLGSVDLETGRCTKGLGIAGHP